ncbi:MAG: hypothetical protein MR469_04445 [Campylobacter sp.]|uniref:hypothetical protein n=1 Tax=Campylobacter sp. TaxID=205 RepID=UPI002AA836FB|nr:hypothetical protein [Campylobacter sp.]MCI6694875.1 hypothetical protein [Campylobacter sp.]MCI6819456.1 hypothetical protein [Campylobacter sp.]
MTNTKIKIVQIIIAIVLIIALWGTSPWLSLIGLVPFACVGFCQLCYFLGRYSIKTNSRITSRIPRIPRIPVLCFLYFYLFLCSALHLAYFL